MSVSFELREVNYFDFDLIDYSSIHVHFHILNNESVKRLTDCLCWTGHSGRVVQ